MRHFILLFVLLVVVPSYGQKNPDRRTGFSEPKWTFRISQPFLASPVIDGNMVFTGGMDSTMYAMDVSSGKVIWKFKTRGQIRSSASIRNGELYFSGGDGIIYCLKKASGKVEWTFTTLGGMLGERRYDPADYFDSQPLIHNEHVFVGSGDGKLYALDAASGKMRWSYQAGDIINTSPVIAKDRIIFGCSDGNLHALDLDGILRWKFKSVGHRNFPKGEMQGSSVVSGDLVFIGARDYNLYAVDVLNGYAHWNKQFPMGWATALVATDTLYAGTSDDRLLAAFDPRSGKELWRLDAGFNIFGPPSISGKMIYAGTQLGKLLEVDRMTGALLRTFTTKGYDKNHLSYFKADDSFRDDIFQLIKGFDGYIDMLYRIGAIYTTPAVKNGLIIFSTSEGMIYCLKQ